MARAPGAEFQFPVTLGLQGEGREEPLEKAQTDAVW